MAKQPGSPVFDGVSTIVGLGVTTRVQPQQSPEYRAFSGDRQKTVGYSHTLGEDTNTMLVPYGLSLGDVDNQRGPINHIGEREVGR